MIAKTFPIGPLQANCTLLIDEQSGEAMVVDPGDEAELILAEIQKSQVTLRHILLTHAHIDHLGAAGDLKKKTDALIWLHGADEILWTNMDSQFAMLAMDPFELPLIDRFLKDGMPLPMLGGVCLHTPGHSPGSCCFYFKADKLLIAGDTLFKNSIGRTDLWGGSFDALTTAIQNKLYTLDDDVVVYTGHGPTTSICEEKQFNSFVRAKGMQQI